MSFKDITYDPNSDSLLFRSRKGNGQKSVSIPASGGYLPLGAIIPVLVNTPITAGAYGVPIAGVVDINGWMLCDGTAIPAGQKLSGSTPDLSNGVYLRGFTASGGALGGSNTLTAANLPSHCHAVGTLVNAPEAAHTHTKSGGVTAYGTCAVALASGSAASAGGHTHSIACSHNTPSTGTAHAVGGSPMGVSDTLVSRATDTQGAHTHTVSGTTDIAHSHADTIAYGAGSSHNHAISGSSAAFGSGTTGNNEPQYMNVRYLIRVN